MREIAPRRSGAPPQRRKNMTETITLVAPDISCGHCVATVQEVAGEQPGVVSVTADADTKQVTLVIDPATASLPTIKDALAEAGYPAQGA
jgi:copper chaperone